MKQPNSETWEAILKAKIEYYGDTKAAQYFAVEEYARQYHEYMMSFSQQLSFRTQCTRCLQIPCICTTFKT